MIYLIDPYGNTGFGHFWKVTLDFYEALTALNLEFSVLTPTPGELTKAREGRITSVCAEVQKVPSILEERIEFFEKFLTCLNMELGKTVVIFTWLPADPPEFYEDFFSRIENQNVSLYAISTLKSTSVIDYNENYSFELQETFEKYSCCKVLWVWHEPNKLVNPENKVRRLPEFHSVKTNTKLSNENSEQLSLSFYGGLSSFRGLGEILLIALFNPGLSIRIKGYGYSKYRVWRPVKSKLFRYSRWQQKPLIAMFIASVSLIISTLRYLPNVAFDPIPFRNEEEFLKEINTSKFCFIGCKLPHSSGVALSSLAAGVPVIWFGDKGEAVRTLIMSSPSGRIDYGDIFVIGRIKKMLTNFNCFNSKEVFSWESMLQEIEHVRSYL